tara:strand:- start:165 stop:323 length:159 start_codon:yes stop_codon:yes gene_type:complete
MSKSNDPYTKRKKGKDKKQNTFNKYGNYTSKGIRHLELIKSKTVDSKTLEKK